MADLQKLKTQVLDELISLTDEGSLDPVDRYELVMTQYVSSGDVSLLEKAHGAAKEIEDPAQKGSALMQILEEIEIAQAEPSGDSIGNQEKPKETAKDEAPVEDIPEGSAGKKIEVSQDEA